MDKEIFELEIGGKTLKIKITDWAIQAQGSCLVSYGGTEVLATAVMSSKKLEQDFFPLTVEYEERFYAAGKIYGSRFIKRESRPTDEAILAARMIDRAIRPLFPKDFKKEVQVVITCLSWDSENDPDYVPKIFQPSSPKLVFWGFVIVIGIVLALAVIGYPIRETAASLP